MKNSDFLLLDLSLLIFTAILAGMSVLLLNSSEARLGGATFLCFVSLIASIVTDVVYLTTANVLYKPKIWTVLALLNLFAAVFVCLHNSFSHPVEIVFTGAFLFVYLSPYFITLGVFCIFVYTRNRALLFLSSLFGLISLICCTRLIILIGYAC